MISVIHTKIGMRISVMPRARMLMIVVKKFTPAASEAMPRICRPTAQNDDIEGIRHGILLEKHGQGVFEHLLERFQELGPGRPVDHADHLGPNLVVYLDVTSPVFQPNPLSLPYRRTMEAGADAGVL